MMKKTLLSALFLSFLLFASPSFAGGNVQSGGNFGVGLQLGYPGDVGLSMNYFLDGGTSLQISPTLRAKNDWIALGSRLDYLFWPGALANLGFADLAWYIGPGGYLYFWSWDGPNDHLGDDDDTYISVGAEMPLGIGFQFSGAPVDLNLEVVPVLSILRGDDVDIDLDLHAGLNARYYF